MAKSPWADLFQQAIIQAEDGFEIFRPRLHSLLDSDPRLREDPLLALFIIMAKASHILSVINSTKPRTGSAVLCSIGENGAAAT